MKFLNVSKDGGPESTVWAYWLAEIKSLFSVGLLRFEDGTRDAFHSHAFNCVSWVLRGELLEEHASGEVVRHVPSPLPVPTFRRTLHRVRSRGRTRVLTFRGPWAKTWLEYLPRTGESIRLAHGRRRVP